MEEKIGIFKGISIIWSKFINTLVKLMNSLDDGASAINIGTHQMKLYAEQWAIESKLDFDIALLEKEKELAAKRAKLSA